MLRPFSWRWVVALGIALALAGCAPTWTLCVFGQADGGADAMLCKPVEPGLRLPSSPSPGAKDEA